MAGDRDKALREIQTLMRSLSQLGENGNVWDEFLHRSGAYIESEAKNKAPVDRGSLRRAIAYEVTQRPLGLTVGVFGSKAKGVPYAKMQEFGGTITIKNKNYLTIPVANKYRDRSPRSIDLTFVSSGGKKFMVDRSTGEIAYALVKAVVIKAQPYLIPAIERYKNEKFKRFLSDALDKHLGD